MIKGKNKQGISLIVLVITIIVMIILAAAVVITLNNTGIINRANEAVNKTNIKEVEQLAGLVWAEEFMDGKRGDTLKTAVLDKLKDYIGKYNIEVTDKGVTVTDKNNAGDGAEELPEEVLAEIELLERYFLGEDKSGREISEVLGQNGFIDDANTIANASTAIEIHAQITSIDAAAGEPLGMYIRSYMFFKYNNKEYIMTYHDSFLQEYGPSKTLDVELAYIPKGREGTIVKYNLWNNFVYEDGTSVEPTNWMILTDEPGNIELLSMEEMLSGYDYSIQEMRNELVYANVLPEIKSDLDSDGTIGDEHDEAIAAYNDAVECLNVMCNLLLFEDSKETLRSVGGNVVDAPAYHSERRDSWGEVITGDIASGDLEYFKDLAKMYYWNATYIGTDYWIASRYIRDYYYDHYSAITFNVMCTKQSDTEWPYTDYENIIGITPGKVLVAEQPRLYLRPVIINPTEFN